MGIDYDLKIRVGEFVDHFMKQYLQLRSEGHSPEGAIDRLMLSCKSDAAKKWHELSMNDRIMQWGNLSFTDDISSIDPTDAEEKKIVCGMVSCMKIICPEKRSTLDQCAAWAREYLRKKYHIG